MCLHLVTHTRSYTSAGSSQLGRRLDLKAQMMAIQNAITFCKDITQPA